MISLHRHSNLTSPRHGSAIIAAILFVLFAFLITSHFLTAMAEMRAGSDKAAQSLLAQIAADTGKAHLKRLLLEHHASTSTDDAARFTGPANDWFQSLQADPSLEPGGAFPDKTAPLENVSEFGAGYTGGKVNDIEDPIYTPILNTTNGGKLVGQGADDIGQFLLVKHGARYFNLGYYDDNFLETAPSEARYKLRYALQVQDIMGTVPINFYPEHGYRVSDLNDAERRLYFAMLRERQATALRSMFNNAQQERFARRSGITLDPYDYAHDLYLDPYGAGASEYLEKWRSLTGSRTYNPAGSDLAKIRDKNRNYGHQNSLGTQMFYTANNLGLIYGYSGQDSTPLLRYFHPGPSFSYEALEHKLPDADSNETVEHNLYRPFNVSLSRRAGDDTDSSLLFNLLTMSNRQVRKLVYGMSAHARFTGDGGGNSNAARIEEHEQDFYGREAHAIDRLRNLPLELLPPAEGRPLQHSNIFDMTDYAIDQNYLANFVFPKDGDPRNNAMLQNQYFMRKWFYALAGDEGMGLGPRTRAIITTRQAPDNGSSSETNLDGVRKKNNIPPILTGTFSDYRPDSSSIISIQQHAMNDSTPGGAGILSYPWYHRSGTPMLPQDSYQAKVLDALSIALNLTRYAWGGDALQHKGTRFLTTEWDKYDNTRSILRDIHAVHRLFLNILGEDVSTDAIGGNENPEDWQATRGILAGERLAYNGNAGSSTRGTNNWIIPNIEPDIVWRKNVPKAIELTKGVHTAGMERYLNDVRMSIFGHFYTKANGDQAIIPPLDFNHDGFAESSYWGFNDGTIDTPTAGTDPRPRFTQTSDSGNPYHPFLAKPDYFPQTPFTTTGRIFMGKSNLFRAIIRGQLYDEYLGQKAAEFNWEVIYFVNPSDKPHTPYQEHHSDATNMAQKLQDSHIIYQRELINPFYSGITGSIY